MAAFPWSRLRKGRLLQVLLVYIGASWVIIEVTDTLEDVLELPDWVAAAVFVLLLAGLLVLVATVWVQSHPLIEHREAIGEVPDPWQLAVRDLGNSIRRGRMPHLTWARALVAGVLLFAILFGITGAYLVLAERGHGLGPTPASAAVTAAPGIAVLPFSVNANELALWREGMIDLLATNLDGLGGMRSIDGHTLLARWSEKVPQGTRPDLATLLDVARSTGAAYAIVGSMVGSGSRVRFLAEPYDLGSGEKLSTAQAEGAVDSIMQTVDALSVGIARALLGDESGAGPPVQHLASVTTSSLDALRHYLEGEALYRANDFEGAEERFRNAVARDTAFALAWLRLGQTVGWLNQWASLDSANRHVHRHIQRLPAREQVLARANLALDRLEVDELGSLLAAARRYDDPDLWFMVGEFYEHLGGYAFPEPDSALPYLIRPIELDPGFAPYYVHAVDMAIRLGDSAQARRLLEGQRRVSPTSEFHLASSLAYRLTFGDSTDKASALAQVTADGRQDPVWIEGSILSPTRVREREAWARASRRSRPLAAALAHQGRLAEVRFLAGDSIDTGSLVARAVMLAVPMPQEVIDRYARALSTEPDAPGPAFFLGRAALAELGVGRHPTGAETRPMQDRALSAGDSLAAARWRAFGRALDAHAALLEGKAAVAATEFEAVRPMLPTFRDIWSESWFVTGWWLARAYDQLDRPHDAIRVLRSMWGGSSGDVPPLLAARIQLELGELHEQVGEPERARAAYTDFLELWRDADPELQPTVRRARTRLAALSIER